MPTILNGTAPDVDVKMLDENGVPYGVKHVDNKVRVSSVPYAYDIVEGNVPGHGFVNKFGFNNDVGATREAIWDYSNTYTYLANDTFATMYISSDNALDTSITYNVQGINSEYNLDSANVSTAAGSGFTFVPVVSNAADGKWWRIFRAYNTSSKAAVGQIYISKDNTDAGGDGIPDTVSHIQAQIKIGMEQTLMAMWTVPVGKTAYMTSYYAGTSSAKVTNVYLFVRPYGGVFNIKNQIILNQGTTSRTFDFPLIIAAKSDIRVQATAAGGGGAIVAGFDLWYE